MKRKPDYIWLKQLSSTSFANPHDWHAYREKRIPHADQDSQVLILYSQKRGGNFALQYFTVSY